jgi:SAM-dependent methyltransferase
MGEPHFCPVCDSPVSKFLPKGRPARTGVRCPVCRADTRTRFAWLFLQRETDLLDGRPKSLLHFAPEQTLSDKLARVEHLEYLTADLDPAKAMLQVDITAMQFDADRFDAVYCSHVLEHVPDDGGALREMLRVLRPGGWALLMIPILQKQTLEDPSVTDPTEREQLFGQHDHVRAYGPDFLDRVRAAGFEARAVVPADFLSGQEAERFGVSSSRGRVIFHARKPV